MVFRYLALFTLAFANLLACVPACGQAVDSSAVNQPGAPAAATSSAAPQTAAGPTDKNECGGGPCQDQRAGFQVNIPPPVPAVWSWHDRVLWAACVVLAIVGYVGMMMALSVLKKIERQTVAAETSATAAAAAAQAALLNAQAIVDSERPWLLIAVEPSPRVENSFLVTAVNRGRTPAMIVATAEGVRFAIDETHLPAAPEFGDAGTPRVPIILLPGESTVVKTFSRDDGRGICESEERFRRVANWEEKAFIYGRLIYRDLIAPQDKQVHETTWCCWYIHGRQKSGLVLAGPHDYNMHT